MPRSAARRLQDEDGVRDGHVLQEIVAALEVGEQRMDRSLVPLRVGRRDRHERLRDRCREVVPPPEAPRQLACTRVVPEHERRKSGRIAPDRALRLRRAGIERPPGLFPGTLRLPGEKP